MQLREPKPLFSQLLRIQENLYGDPFLDFVEDATMDGIVTVRVDGLPPLLIQLVL